jgi:hypothetical protein
MPRMMDLEELWKLANLGVTSLTWEMKRAW